MTDPQNPDVPTPPPAYTQTPPPAYSAAPPAAYDAPPASPTIPGKTLGIVAIFVAIFFNVIGLILGIVALVQSKKAGHKNGPAVAAIVIGAVLFVIGIIISIVAFGVIAAGVGELARLCAEYGSGVHEINGVDVTLSC